LEVVLVTNTVSAVAVSALPRSRTASHGAFWRTESFTFFICVNPLS